jgi:hypothetical protein
MYNIETRRRIKVNTDPQRRCYYGVHARSELQWTGWETLEFELPATSVDGRVDWWKELNDFAVSERGESARREFRKVLTEAWESETWTDDGHSCLGGEAEHDLMLPKNDGVL